MSEFLILGAGMVGISTALALQSRGHAVQVIDRRSPGRETSHGNAGIIQVEAAEPYALPRHWPTLMRLGLGLNNDLTWSVRGLQQHARALWHYYRYSAPSRHQQLSMSYAALTRQANDDHARLIDAAGAQNLIRREGYCCVYRDPRSLEAAIQEMNQLMSRYGVRARSLDGAAYRREEPAIIGNPAGAIHWQDCWTCSDPGALVQHYADLFVQRGGSLVRGDAQSLSRTHSGWHVSGTDGDVHAEQVVIALGPWSPSLLQRFDISIPMIGKRGYHAHHDTADSLHRPLFDVANGIVASPMSRGLRLCTGAALVPMDAPMDTRQLERGRAGISTLLHLGDCVDEKPWQGTRPCLPDMLPLVGRSPTHDSLWFNFGHGHQGFTLGPTTARVLADAVSGEKDTQSMQDALSPRARL